jgi:hypothetical protein
MKTKHLRKRETAIRSNSPDWLELNVPLVPEGWSMVRMSASEIPVHSLSTAILDHSLGPQDLGSWHSVRSLKAKCDIRPKAATSCSHFSRTSKVDVSPSESWFAEQRSVQSKGLQIGFSSIRRGQ